MEIGNWVKRSGGKWHLVESTVDGAAVIRCGKTMEPKTKSGGQLEVSEVEPLTRMIGQPQNCKVCS